MEQQREHFEVTSIERPHLEKGYRAWLREELAPALEALEVLARSPSVSRDQIAELAFDLAQAARYAALETEARAAAEWDDILGTHDYRERWLRAAGQVLADRADGYASADEVAEWIHRQARRDQQLAA